MLRIFIGYEEKQPIAYHALCQSIIDNSSVPVAITPLVLDALPIKRKGLTNFTYSRYLVPYLCEFKGKAIFLDSDMLVLGDIAELLQYSSAPVSVVPFKNQMIFERPSVMVFNNEKCTELTPKYIDDENNHPQSFDWAENVGELPKEWNYLVGYDEFYEGVKLIHYTQGIPAYKECRDCDFAGKWFMAQDKVNHYVSWLEILGRSVHAKHVLKKLSDKYGA